MKLDGLGVGEALGKLGEEKTRQNIFYLKRKKSN